MNTPRWMFFVLTFWILATIWCNALEPTKTDLLSTDITGSVESMRDTSLASASGFTTVWAWVQNIWKALTFDYAIFTGWLVILRYICIAFTVASLYFIIDMIWKVRTMLFGQ